MKINFNATFESVQKALNARSSPSPESKADFGPLLGSLLEPPSGSHTISPKSEDSSPKSLFGAEDSMARFQFSEPSLTPPKMEAVIPEQLKPPEDPDGGSVKKPSGLEARRIPRNATSVSEEVASLKSMVDLAGRDHGIDPALGKAVVEAESSFNVRAISADGHASKGLFQLLDSTGKNLKARLDVSGKYDPFNPDMNVHLGVNYLRYLHEIFSKDTALPNSLTTIAAANSSSLEKLAVAAFNAGEGRVASAQARAMKAGKDPARYDQVELYLPESTKEYVKRVLQFRERYGEEGNG